MEVLWSSETSIDFHPTTWRYIPENTILYTQSCENLKSKIKYADKM
jgi:hypothetical protein